MKTAKTIVGVEKSSTEKGRWLLKLECGHEFWVSQPRKPNQKTTMCAECEELRHNPLSANSK
jgi:hypothetical protein